MLILLPGQNIGKANKSKINILHLFFVDDLKTFAKNKNKVTLHLDLITRFRNDDLQICFRQMWLHLHQVGWRKSLGTKLTINNTGITETETGKTYKHLKQDEGELNKQRVMKEYLKRVRKFWNSELYS